MRIFFSNNSAMHRRNQIILNRGDAEKNSIATDENGAMKWGAYRKK
jgi:hypothetical protein